jgi:hypothetical protein
MGTEEQAARREREKQEQEAALNRWKNALAIFGVFVLLPAFVRWQVSPDDLDPWLLVGVAGVGGLLAGLVWRAEARLIGALGGALAGVGALYAVDYYLTDRSEVFVFELLLPLVVGCLPGFLVFFGLSRMASGKETPSRPRRRKKIR